MFDSLLVFGGGGFVGGNLCTIAAARGVDVYIADSRVRDAIPGASWRQIDVTNQTDVLELLSELRPDCVVDLAAVSDIDLAEQNNEVAERINVTAAQTIAQGCARFGSHFLYFSSDAVYSGTHGPYKESDPLEPVNYYGRSKKEGEAAIRAELPGATLVRISLALGFPVTDGNSFFASLLDKLTAGKSVAAPADEIRTPLDVLTISECVLELLEQKHAGPVNLGSTSSIDRGTLARRVASLLGFPDAEIDDSPARKPGRAPRHKKGIIDVSLAQRRLKVALPDAEGAIERAIKERLDR